jgi:hypothetical protein
LVMSEPVTARSTLHAPSAERITPEIVIADPWAAYWAGQAILRLRRELAWCWHQRGDAAAPAPRASDERLPPFGDTAQDSLDLLRHGSAKKAFFESDVAAGYLTHCIESLEAPGADMIEPGSWVWLAERLGLSDAEQFVLGLALAMRLDAALAPVCAACLNDRSRPFPTLALAQRLWDEPLAILGSAQWGHALYRFALLERDERGGDMDWQAPLQMPTTGRCSIPSARRSASA